jgi:hypothetical protein
MKEPEKIPLDPSTPRTKSVNKFPLNKLYPEKTSDDLYRPDRDSIYTEIKDEDSKESNKT